MTGGGERGTGGVRTVGGGGNCDWAWLDKLSQDDSNNY